MLHTVKGTQRAGKQPKACPRYSPGPRACAAQHKAINPRIYTVKYKSNPHGGWRPHVVKLIHAPLAGNIRNPAFNKLHAYRMYNNPVFNILFIHVICTPQKMFKRILAIPYRGRSQGHRTQCKFNFVYPAVQHPWWGVSNACTVTKFVTCWKRN